MGSRKSKQCSLAPVVPNTSDLEGIALLHLAKQKQKEVDAYTEALSKHFEKQGMCKEAADNAYEALFENYTYEQLKDRLKVYHNNYSSKKGDKK